MSIPPKNGGVLAGFKQWRCVGWCHLQPRGGGTKRCLKKREILRDMVEWEWSESNQSLGWHKSQHTRAHSQEMSNTARSASVSLASSLLCVVPLLLCGAINFVGWWRPRMPGCPVQANAALWLRAVTWAWGDSSPDPSQQSIVSRVPNPPDVAWSHNYVSSVAPLQQHQNNTSQSGAQREAVALMWSSGPRLTFLPKALRCQT